MVGQTASPTPVAGEPILDLAGGAAVWLIVGVTAGLVLTWAIPLYLETRRAYKAFRKEQVPLIKAMIAAQDEGKLGLSSEQKGELVSAATRRFEATSGLTRALMAFAVISVLGAALIAVLVSSAADAVDLRKTIVTALLSILATIVGFFFGSRTAESAGATEPGAQGEPRQSAGETPAGSQT